MHQPPLQSAALTAENATSLPHLSADEVLQLARNSGPRQREFDFRPQSKTVETAAVILEKLRQIKPHKGARKFVRNIERCFAVYDGDLK